MYQDILGNRSDISLSSNRRTIMRLLAGGSLALAGAMIAGCSNMEVDPDPKRGDSYVNGRGGGPSGGIR